MLVSSSSFLFYILFCFIGEFLLNIPYWLHFSVRSFSCTSHAGFILFGGVTLTHPVLGSFFYRGNFSYTSHAGFIFIWGVSLKHPVLASFLSGELLLHIPCWLCFYVRSFCDTSRGAFIFFISGVSLTHPVLSWFICKEFLLHIPCLHPFFFSFSFFPFNWGSFYYTSRTGFIFIWVVSLTHVMLALLFCGEFLLHIPCWLQFHLGSFSYTSHAGFTFLWGISVTHARLFFFFFIWGVSLTHPVLASFLSEEFLLYIRSSDHFHLGRFSCWLHFYVGSFSSTYSAGFNLISWFSLTQSILVSFLWG